MDSGIESWLAHLYQELIFNYQEVMINPLGIQCNSPGIDERNLNKCENQYEKIN